jgi:2,5-diketo-D-gluconic acid reductase
MLEVELNNHTFMPQVGFGTYKVVPEQASDAVYTAISYGYRHIDTAQLYFNEAEVGQGIGKAIADGLVSREQLYVTTKLNNNNHAPADVERSFDESLAKLGCDYVDLFLVHWPMPNRADLDMVATWKAMTKLLEDGRLRSIGVSNFLPEHIEHISQATGVMPVNNQIELHPQFMNRSSADYCRQYGIAVTAWSPLARGRVFDTPQVTTVAQQLGVTPAQAVLRWHIQLGNVVIPKSVTPARIAANLDIDSFELSSQQMELISSLDQGEAGRSGKHPDYDWL